MLDDMTEGRLTKVSGTTPEDQKVVKHVHLRAAFRNNDEVLVDDLPSNRGWAA